MNKSAQLVRLARILWTLRKHGLLRLMLYYYPNWFLRLCCLFDGYHLPPTPAEQALKLRLCLEDLGAIFVKFGQLLSTRCDLLPEEWIVELTKLQDRVPPFDTQIFIEILEATFNKPVTELFTDFQPIPLGSASIAQVHAARLPSGEEVIIKMLRPNIERFIVKDIAVLALLAIYIEKYIPGSKRLRPIAVVKEFEYTLIEELDLQREAANAAQLRRNFKNTSLLHVPKIYWDYTRQHILVMERVHGIQVNDIAQLKAHNVPFKKLAENGVEIFFTQVFRDSFFHADMHPGNVFIDVRQREKPKYIAIDFGIMGSLSTADKRYLAENFLAFFNQDYRRVAELHIQSGWIPATTRVEAFESAIRTVCEPIFEKPLKDISFGQTLLRLFQTAQRFDMEIQPQLILLQKTLFTIEGVGRQLYPELDLWKTAKPYLERWAKDQFQLKRVLKALEQQAPYWIERLITPTRRTLQPLAPPPTVLVQKSTSQKELIGVICILSGSLLLLLSSGAPLHNGTGLFLILIGILVCLSR